MSQTSEQQGIQDRSNFTQQVTGGEVPMVDDAVAVGEDLKFQERWWKFERITWSIFIVILLADVLGAFGGGPLAKAKIDEPGTGMNVTYERVERTGTPSMMSVQFGPDAVRDGKVTLFVSDTVVKGLGAQRVIPQPETSSLTGDGVTYTFPASATAPGQVRFELSPSGPGVFRYRLQIPGKTGVMRSVVVMP